MPILVRCPSCAGQLRILDELIGRKARCPACQTIFDAVAPPEAELAPDPPAAPVPTPSRAASDDLPIETVRVEPWRQLDLELASPPAEPAPVPVPAPAAVPAAEPEPAPPPRRPGLVGAVEVEPGPQEPPRRPSEPARPAPPRDGPDRRGPAGPSGDLAPCPGCGKMVHNDSRRCYSCGALLSARVPDRRDGPPRDWDRDRDRDRDLPPRSFSLAGGPPRRDSEPHRGNTILVLGVLSLACLLFFFFLVPAVIGVVLGGIGWYMGHVDLRRMKRDTMDPSGRGTTQGGWICSILGTLLNLLVLVSCGGCVGFSAYQDMQRSQQMKPKTFQPPPKVAPAPVRPNPPKKRPAAEENF
jgi:hypothetical protein